MVALAKPLVIEGTVYPAGTDHTAIPADVVDRSRNPDLWAGGTAPALSGVDRERLHYTQLSGTATELRSTLGVQRPTDPVTGLFTFARHESSTGNPTMGVAAGAAAASAARTGTATSNDAAGQVTATALATPVAGVLATMTYGATYGTTPRSVVITPTNAAAATAGLYVSSQSATAFAVSCANAPAASAVITFAYRVTA